MCKFKCINVSSAAEYETYLASNRQLMDELYARRLNIIGINHSEIIEYSKNSQIY